MISGGAIVNIIMKSAKARLITIRFDGVRRPLVEEKIKITHPFPTMEMSASSPMVVASAACHFVSNGGN